MLSVQLLLGLLCPQVLAFGEAGPQHPDLHSGLFCHCPQNPFLRPPAPRRGSHVAGGIAEPLYLCTGLRAHGVFLALLDAPMLPSCPVLGAPLLGLRGALLYVSLVQQGLLLTTPASGYLEGRCRCSVAQAPAQRPVDPLQEWTSPALWVFLNHSLGQASCPVLLP